MTSTLAAILLVLVAVASVLIARVVSELREEAAYWRRIASTFEQERNAAYARVLDLEELVRSRLPRIGQTRN